MPSSTPAGMSTVSALALLDPALAAAGRAGIGDRLAQAPALRAGLLDDEETVARPNLALAAAHLAGAGARPGLGARAAARLARRGAVDIELDRAAGEGVLQADLEIVAQVRSAQHIAAPRLAAEHVAEHGIENVGEAGEILRPAAKAAIAAAILESGMAEAVIGGALLRVLQAIIGFADRLELRFLLLAAGMLVRMAFHREPAIGGLDRRRVRAALHLQQLVIIGFNHDAPASASPRRKPGSQGEVP